MFCFLNDLTTKTRNFKLLNSFIYLINHKIYRNLLFRVEGQQWPSTAPITLFFPPTKKTGKKTSDANRFLLTLSQTGSCTEQISSFNHSKIKAWKETNTGFFSDRPSQKDRVVSFANSKRANLPKKRHVNKSQKKYNIYLYSYINIQRDQMLFYHWFLHSVPHPGAKHAGSRLPFFFFSVLFHRRSVGLCIVGFVLSSCPIPPYSNLWRHKMMMKCGK